MRLRIKKIIVEETVRDEPLTKNILSKFDGLPVNFVEKLPYRKNEQKDGELIVARQKGRFIKKCPGTPNYACCDYYVLNTGIGCSINCTYCYLHRYMNTPYMVFANSEDLVQEVGEFCKNKTGRTIRLGNGEFVDSLEFDEITGINKLLIPALGKIPNLIFELKTKKSNVSNLFSLEHNGRTVVSWSVNPDKIIESEERNAAPLKQRLEAAVLCQNAGYKVGFHFDPIIYYKNWFDDYKTVVDMIFKHVDARNIAWISLGVLRFNPSLKPIMKEKFPESEIAYGELVPGLDGKLRYFMGIRKDIFSKMAALLRSYSESIPVYLCMENRSLAKETGAIPCFSLNRS